MISNAAGQAVWRLDHGEPFGNSSPDENPSGLGAFEFPLRFPGQYFDKETNLHYNYFRDYDPSLGRYVESDPIGLDGGLNTYLYVLSPLLQVDPEGLMGNAPGKGPYPPGTGPGISPWQIIQNIGSAFSVSGTLQVNPYCDGRWMRVGKPRLAPFPRVYLAVGRVPECQCDWICRSCPGGSDLTSLPIIGTHITTAKQIYGGGTGIKQGDICLCKPPGPEKGCTEC